MIVPGTKSLNACQVYFIRFENLGPVSPNLNENLLLVVPTGAAAEKFLKFDRFLAIFNNSFLCI